MANQRHNGLREENTSTCSYTISFVIGLLCILIGVVLVVVGSVRLQSAKKPCGQEDPTAARRTSPSAQKGTCKYSAEAVRVGLPGLLEEVKKAYFEYNPNNVAWHPDKRRGGIVEVVEYVKTRYAPYDPAPAALKRMTDASFALLDKLQNLQVNATKLKPREGKALSQAKHFLQHVFGRPYDVNYYAGDWLMGPNYFCWQPICYMAYGINAFAWHVKPHTYSDVQHVIDKIMKHKETIERYRDNIALGVQVGMVRSSIECKAGLDAFKEKYPKVAYGDTPESVLEEWYTKLYLKPQYLARLERGVNKRWQKEHGGQNVTKSIKQALVNGLGKPLLNLIQWLENEHSRHCLPDDVASGLANLPVDFVYTDGIPDKKNRTTKVLPGTRKRLNGMETYSQILSFFTTINITAEELYKEGKAQLDNFMPLVYKIAKLVTGINKRAKAVEAFKIRLNSSDQWHNTAPFPANESDANAHEKCKSPSSAKVYCPRRWAAIQSWIKYIQTVMSMIYPKIQPLFYFTGPKTTAANCPIRMKPHYNPSNGAMFFSPSNANCTNPTYFGLPFFLKEYGPKFQEWSVIGHESRPGHHTQMQGLVENFRDKCDGVPRWLDKETSYVAFQEGWALYAENPLLSDDTNLYDDDLLQKYGMVKWQVWRAVRLVVDTGLHYRGMTRSQALKYFEDYTWDKTDFAIKEVTRYQSNPGQATAYMLGRLALVNMRKKVKKALGKHFDLREFHYQLLRQGSAPLSYLESYIDKYIDCYKGKIEQELCDGISRNSEEEKNEEVTMDFVNQDENLPPRPTQRIYV